MFSYRNRIFCDQVIFSDKRVAEIEIAPTAAVKQEPSHKRRFLKHIFNPHMNWNEYKKEFEWDGSWRDLYILHTDNTHWQSLIDLLQTTAYKTIFKVDNEIVTLPKNVAEIFQKSSEMSVLMSVELNGIILNCHFFTDEEIEFDIDPREIDSEEKLHQLFKFMRRLGQMFQKEVILTPENAQELIIFRYEPETDKIQHID